MLERTAEGERGEVGGGGVCLKEQVCMCLMGHKWEKGKRERWMTKCDKRMGVALGGKCCFQCVCV